MKLIDIQIDNFGKLSGKYKLTNNICELYKENGYGKSTFADFITVMFYGFENENGKRSSAERAKYKPWQGGIYGGEIRYEFNNNTYKLKRVFGDKPKDDTASLWNETTNLEEKLPECLGLSIFEVDRESYINSIYINNEGCKSNITPDIHAKINQQPINSNDIANFDLAIEKIDKKIKELTSSIKKAKKDIVDKNTLIINETIIQNKINNYTSQCQNLETSIKNIEVEIKSLEDEQTRLSKYTKLKGLKTNYEEISKNCNAREEKLKNDKSLLNNIIPDEDELNDMLEKANELERYNTNKSAYQLNDLEDSEYNDLLNLLSNKDISDTKFEEIKNTKDLINEYKKELNEYYVSKEENEAYEKYHALFLNVEDVKHDIELMHKKLERLKSLGNFKVDKPSKVYIVFLILSIISLVLGVITYIYKYNIVAIVSLILCLIFLVLFIILFVMSKNGQKHYTANKMEISTLENELKNSINKYGVDIISSFDSSLVEIESNLKNYINMYNRKKKYNELYETRHISEKEKQVIDYISQFIQNANYENAGEDLMNIKFKFNKFNELKDKKNKYEEFNKKFINLKQEIKDYLSKIGYSVEHSFEKQLLQIKDNLKAYHNSLKEYTDANNTKLEFEKNNNINELNNIIYNGTYQDLPSLTAVIQQKNDELNDNKTKLDDTSSLLENEQEYLDQINDAKIDINTLNKNVIDDEKKKDDLEITKQYLEKAKDNFVNKYVKPLKNAFDKYYGLCTGMQASNYQIDAKAKVTYNELGAYRDIDTLSSGYQDVVGLCYRLAIIESMYKNEKPFIIMDDPFSSLDDNKIKLSIDLLKKISVNYQIIYLTCHNSRKI